MSSFYISKDILIEYLPINIVNKIIYQYKPLSTPSCEAFKIIINILKKKVDNYNETIIIIPKKRRCKCGNIIYKINANWGIWWGLIICTKCNQKYLNK